MERQFGDTEIGGIWTENINEVYFVDEIRSSAGHK